MAKESLGDKLGQQVEQIKGGVKNVAQYLTEEDTEPRIGMAGHISGPRYGKPDSKTKAASMTKEQLYADAKRMGIKGRSKMTKNELAKAVRRHR
ncbi:Rho termination factor [Kribbella pittospori]|uniref:Rho termination factor n=1 Tax=Kribbella pittospori TaxID=722689 RepID=A0A4V2M9D2_9ACTN|nr:Rho termination factor N-terminal domain-containing protein [Kribbella pittospori]TCC54962.1 Rho termination factor [Kribbella pittospori]